MPTGARLFMSLANTVILTIEVRLASIYLAKGKSSNPALPGHSSQEPIRKSRHYLTRVGGVRWLPTFWLGVWPGNGM